MSKTLRTVGQIAGVAALIAGTIVTGGALGVVAASVAAATQTVATVASIAATAATLGSQALAKPPPVRGNVSQILIAPDVPQPYLMGEGYYAGVLRHDAAYGATLKDVPNPYRGMVVVYSGGGPIQSIAPYVDKLAVTAWYSGYLYTDTQLGDTPESAALSPHYASFPGWSASSKLSGEAAILWNLLFDKKGKRFASGVPQIGAYGQWVKAYDPRSDDTFPGGSGDHRVDDETTWEWTESPALHFGTYAYGRHQNGLRTIGCGLTSIDWGVIAAWANVCEANDWTIFGVVYEPGNRWDNLKDIAAAGGGVPVVSSGGRLSVKYWAPQVALDTITAADLADGQVTYAPLQSWDDRVNTIVPRYTSGAHEWNQVAAEPVSISAFVTEDGEEKRKEWPYNLVKQAGQAAQLAAYQIYEGREINPIVIPCGPRMRAYRPGECLTIDLPDYGLELDAIILQRQLDPATMTVTLTLIGETDAKHAAALGHTPAPPATPVAGQTGEDRDETVYDTAANPPREVADLAALLALDVPIGTVVKRTDNGSVYFYNGGTSGTIADWTLLAANYTDEMAQDAVGAMVDASLVYVDATPLLTRAAFTGDVTATQGSNALTIANDAVTFAKFQNIATAKVLGRFTASTGDVEELATTGTGSVAMSVSPTFTGQISAAIISATSYVAAVGGVQATGARTYAGAGLGLQYSGGTCFLQAFDHGGAVYLPLTINGSTINLGPSGTNVIILTTAGIVTTVTTYYPQGAGNAVNATATLTIAQMLATLIFTTSTTAVSLTLPTGTLTDAGVVASLANDRAFEWCVINLGSAAGAITMLAGTNHTYTGNATIAIGTSAQFRTRKTAANTYVTYRIA